MVDGYQTFGAETVNFGIVMDNVAEAVETLRMRQFFLGLVDGRGDAEAESRTFVNLDECHDRGS